MNNSNYFRAIFESLPDYRKIVLIIFSIQNYKNLIGEIGYSKNEIYLLNLEFKNMLIKGYEK